MHRLPVLTALALLASFNVTAQDWAKTRLDKSPRHLEWIKIPQGKREVQAFIGYPEVSGKVPAVILIHEIFGLTDWVRGMTDQFAEAGYIAIAPDLLSGAAPNGGGTSDLGGPDGVRRAISSLPPSQVTADLKAVIDYVSKLPACSGKVVVAGFCWGGGQSFRFATDDKELKAALVFYGTGPTARPDIDRINCPVYGFYGGNDARVTATVPKTTELMKESGKTYEPVVYEGAGHGFMRGGEAPDARPADQKARDAAWTRIKEIMKKI